MSLLSKKSWTEAELLESLRIVGQLLPVFYWRGQVLDGRRRLALMSRLGRRPRRRRLHDDAAAHVLWLLHPDRALERWPGLSVVEAARMFGVQPSAVAAARVLPSRPGSVPTQLHAALRESVPLRLRLPATLRARLELVARRERLTLSAYVRQLLRRGA